MDLGGFKVGQTLATPAFNKYPRGVEKMFRGKNSSFLEFLWETRFIIVFYIFGDWITTKYGLQYAREGNSLLLGLIEDYGIYSLLAVKLVFMVFLFWNYKLLKRSNSDWTKYIWDASRDALGIFGVLLTISNLLVIYNYAGLFSFMG